MVVVVVWSCRVDDEERRGADALRRCTRLVGRLVQGIVGRFNLFCRLAVVCGSVEVLDVCVVVGEV